MARAVAAGLLCLFALAGCGSDAPDEEVLFPAECGLPSPGPRVDASDVPEQYLLDGLAVVSKVTSAKGLFVVALNVPLTVNGAFGAYLDALGPPRYRVITKDNEGFEAEIYYRDVETENLMSVVIRQPRCVEAVAVYITEDRRET
ncbi:MAG: hypothetical protein ACRDLB_03780 [Actinomycetota bacterium]